MTDATTTVGSASVRKLLTIVSFIMSGCLVEASPKIEFVAMAAPDVIELVIQAGQVNVGRQIPYVKQDGDVVKERGHSRYLYRNGNKIGVVIGPDGDILRPFDTFTAEPLDTKWADSKASYSITSATDVKLRPVEVHRKSRPTGVARTDDCGAQRERSRFVMRVRYWISVFVVVLVCGLTYETKQIKRLFHGEEGKVDMEMTAALTEKAREPLTKAIKAAFKPVRHTVRIEAETAGR